MKDKVASEPMASNRSGGYSASNSTGRKKRSPAQGASSLAEEAYLEIRRMIFEQELAPGTRTGEAELTRRLSVSRTPVRDALARLETEGLLYSGPGRGYVVVELDEGDLEDVYQVRAALEGLAAEAAARRCNRVDVARLEDIFEAMEAALEAQEDALLAELNSTFHALLGEVGGNNYLQTMLEEIREVFERFRTTALTVPGRREEAHREHRQMIDALRSSDAEGAGLLAREHVHRAFQARRSVFADKSERGGKGIR